MTILGLSGWVADRTTGAIKAAALLAHRFATIYGQQATVLGEFAQMPDSPERDALERARPYLVRVSAKIEALMAEASTPLVFANRCAVSLATLPPVFKRSPNAYVVWLDAHGEFNTPQTSPSGYLGGMHLAALCGLWDSGLGAGLTPERLLLVGARDLDPPEKELVQQRGVQIIPPSDGTIDIDAVLRVVAGQPTIVHLDLDVLEPGYLPTEYQVPNGVRPAAIRALLAHLAESSELLMLTVAELDFVTDRFDSDTATVFSMIEPIAQRLMRVR